MKTALVKCPYIEPFPPDIGLGYLASFLREAGNEVSIFDFNIEAFRNFSDEKREKCFTSDNSTLKELAEGIIFENPRIIHKLADRILKTGARVIGLSVWDSNIFFSLKLAEAVKEADKDILTIFGGPECYPLWSGNSFIKNDFIDLVIFGEGELALRQIAESIKRSGKIKAVSGCIIKKGDEIINCGPAEVIDNLDALPFPDYQEFPLDLYPNNKQLFISFNRGCPRKCAYCSVPGTIPLYRFRSAGSIHKEIKFQMEKHPGVSKFIVASPALNSNLKQLSQLCDLIINDRIEINWGGNAIIRADMDIDLLRKMKEAGCSNLAFGLESGSQNVLDKMGKSFRIEDAERLLCDTHEIGIKSITVNFIIGFPGEEDSDFCKTLKFIERNKDYIDLIGSYTTCWIEPYAPIYYEPEKYGVVSNHSLHSRKSQDWYTEDKRNNPEIRQKRQEIFNNFVSTLDLHITKKSL